MTLQPLLDASPVIQIHAFCAMAAFLLGAIVLFRRKGDRPHRFAGRLWVALMVIVAASSLFIHTIRVWGPWSPIHLLSIATLAALTYAIVMIRRRDVTTHARVMKSTYVGALLVAGAFTLAPGRIMNHVVFGTEAASARAETFPLHAHAPTVADILAHTPIWVWPLLLYVLHMGWKRTRDRIVAPFRLLIMPAIITCLAVYNLVSAGPSMIAVVGFACGAIAGGLAGYAIARRRVAEFLENGMLRVKGDWVPLVLVVGIFAIRYATGVALGVDPALAHNQGFLFAGVALSGFFAGTLVARALGALPPELFRSYLQA